MAPAITGTTGGSFDRLEVLMTTQQQIDRLNERLNEQQKKIDVLTRDFLNLNNQVYDVERKRKKMFLDYKKLIQQEVVGRKSELEKLIDDAVSATHRYRIQVNAMSEELELMRNG